MAAVTNLDGQAFVAAERTADEELAQDRGEWTGTDIPERSGEAHWLIVEQYDNTAVLQCVDCGCVVEHPDAGHLRRLGEDHGYVAGGTTDRTGENWMPLTEPCQSCNDNRFVPVSACTLRIDRCWRRCPGCNGGDAVNTCTHGTVTA